MASNKLYLDVFIRSSCGKQLKCTICDCWLPSGAEKFVTSHVAGRKHKEQFEKKRNQEKKLQCSVYIKGFDPLLLNLEDELSKYFEAMGIKVKDIYIDKNTAAYGIIEFMSKDDVDIVLEFKRSLFHDKKLVIKKREATKKTSSDISDPKVEENFNDISSLLPKDLEDEMKKKTDVCEQMKLLKEFFALTHEELLLRNLICELIENVLEELYPGCKVLLFGSSSNGLGEKGCDVDLTLIAEGVDDEGTVCSEIREVIQRFAPGCKNVSVVQSTKTCSIVKFFHTESNLSVDLSLNNYLAINNTELLRMYINYDERVPLVTFTIRKWAKCFGLSGRNNCQITQYSLTLMVIYFLQKLQPTVLPCLQNCHPSDEVKIGQWNCSFCKCDKHNSLDNKSSATDLLFKFFNFYCSFDFSHNVIAIHSSSVLSRNDVCKTVNKLSLGDANKDLKFGSPLVIQDPFKLSHNVAHNLSLNGLQLLKDAFKQAFSYHKEKDLVLLSLTRLFTQTKKTSTRQKQKRKRNRSNIYSISLPNCKHVSDVSEFECFNYVKDTLLEDLRMRISELNVVNEHSEKKTISELTEDKIKMESEQQVVGETDIVSSFSNGLKRNADEFQSEGLVTKKLKTESIVCMTFTATAYADTWTNRRKQRRLIQKLRQTGNTEIDIPHEVNEDADSGIIMSDVSIPNTDASNLLTEAESHVLLQFKVIITKASNENEICKLKLEPLDDLKNLQDFQTFYAYIKKELISIFK